MESTLYWDYGGIMVGLYVDSRWAPGRLHMDSMDFEILQVHRHLESTWSPGGVQVYSSKTPWMLPGVQAESR